MDNLFSSGTISSTFSQDGVFLVPSMPSSSPWDSLDKNVFPAQLRSSDASWILSDRLRTVDLFPEAFHRKDPLVHSQAAHSSREKFSLRNPVGERLIGDRQRNFLVGSLGNDIIRGNGGNDTLKGHSGGDRLWGDGGDDLLDGGVGMDTLNGGNGDDTLLDYDGGDRLLGGQGTDEFGVGSPLGTGLTRVMDFQVGIDHLKHLRLGASFEDMGLKARQGGTLVFDQGEAIAFLAGVKPNQINAESFEFGDAQLADELQQNLDQALQANPQTTGLSSALFAPDGSVWVGFAGVVDRESQSPIDHDSLFGVGSITKPMMATLVLQLQQEGVLNLDDTLSQWLPNFARQIPNRDRITIAQLLGHTSGIRDYSTEPALVQEFYRDPTAIRRNYSTRKLLSYIAYKRAVFRPGESYSYSNSNYLLLGEIIEKATGSTLAEELGDRIFRPLGMRSTFFAPQETVNPQQITHSYLDFDGDGELDDLKENLSWAGAAGGIVSNAADIAKFAQALFQGELLAPDTLHRMIYDRSDLPLYGALKQHHYGLGVESGRYQKLGDFWGHDGATVGWQSDMAYLRDRQMVAVNLASASEDTSEDLAIYLTIQNLYNTMQRYSSVSSE